ncbi:hypothetical protein [Caulobacter sp. DWR1-3-2b1]|uniref:hypothetical protein n=1 Tax=Caulobacter sp. DWR1-3-2b1 TaxID=2804670 RepID=UPI003CEC3558
MTLTHPMKQGVGAMAMTVVLTAAPGAWAQSQSAAPAPATTASLEERLGCGFMFLSASEIIKAYPALAPGVNGNSEGASAMLRMFGASGATMFNAAAVEASAQGMAPADTHRQALGYLTKAFQGVKNYRGSEGKARAMALLNRCAAVVAPRS